MQIYVGNLPVKTTDDDLKKMFEPYGAVKAATVGRDPKTEKSQGYGFVEMPVKSEARKAIESLRGTKPAKKPLLVRALKPGDDFYQHALAVHGGARQNQGFKGQTFRGNPVPRAGGAIRRSGNRGS